MRIARTATSVIWKTVVFAGAMLAAPSCSGGGGMRTVCDPPEETYPAQAKEPAAAEVVSTGEPVAIGAAKIAVTITSNPAGAEVYIDGVLQGVTPVKFEMPSADMQITVKVLREGYAEEQRLVRADRDQEIALALGEAVASRPRCYQVRQGRGFVLS